MNMDPTEISGALESLRHHVAHRQQVITTLNEGLRPIPILGRPRETVTTVECWVGGMTTDEVYDLDERRDFARWVIQWVDAAFTIARHEPDSPVLDLLSQWAVAAGATIESLRDPEVG